MALNAEPDPDEPETDDEKKRAIKFPLPAYLLKEFDYNIKNRMGTIIKSQKRWDFSDRRSASDAYKKAFCQNGKRQAKEDRKRAEDVTRIFDDDKLKWLNALRNVLVHNGGRADQKFLSQIKGNATFAATAIDTHVHLDGEIIGDLVENSIKCGQQLIAFVAQEIGRHLAPEV